MLDRFVSKGFQRYYLALLACVLLIDYGVLPLVPFVSYSSHWYLTGITINGQPLFLVLEYPFALAFWLSVIRLVQIHTGRSWRTAYYAGFMIFAVVEEAFNE